MFLVGSDIRDARSQDPVARRRLADLIRDACINVRSRPRPRYPIRPIYYCILRLDFSMVSLRCPLKFIWNSMTGVMILLRMKCLVHSHGIPEEVIDNAVKAAKRYFSLPESAKMEVSLLYYRVSRLLGCSLLLIIKPLTSFFNS